MGKGAGRPLLGLVVASLSFILGVSNASAGSHRPQLQSWAQQLQHDFDQLPAVGTAVPLTRVEGCAAIVTILEEARTTLIPSPTPELEDAFRAYIDALLAFYQECPDNLARARLLHERANDKGRYFEDLVNRSLPGR